MGSGRFVFKVPGFTRKRTGEFQVIGAKLQASVVFVAFTIKGIADHRKTVFAEMSAYLMFSTMG